MKLFCGSIPTMHADKNIKPWIQRLNRLKQRWMPLVTIRPDGDGPDDDGLYCRQFMMDCWQDVAIDEMPEETPFSRQVLLIPDRHVFFRCRLFPVDMVSAADLSEAVELDLQQWLPFVVEANEQARHLSSVERAGDQWRVAVWVWPESLHRQLLSRLPESLHITHMLPEMAWRVSQVRGDKAVLLIADAATRTGYLLLTAAGMPQALDWPESQSAARRFWRSRGHEAAGLEQVLRAGDREVWSPDGVPVELFIEGLPRYHLLNRARQAGILDWSDPLSWKKPILAMATLLLLWMFADAAVLTQRSEAIDSQFSAISASAHDVLKRRELVETMHKRLVRTGKLKQQQGRVMVLLAALTEGLPEDMWIEILQLNGNWLDMSGKGKDVAQLLSLLENAAGVEKVMLLNDIRPDARSGLETFQIRLILTSDDSPAAGQSDV